MLRALSSSSSSLSSSSLSSLSLSSASSSSPSSAHVFIRSNDGDLSNWQLWIFTSSTLHAASQDCLCSIARHHHHNEYDNHHKCEQINDHAHHHLIDIPRKESTEVTWELDFPANHLALIHCFEPTIQSHHHHHHTQSEIEKVCGLCPYYKRKKNKWKSCNSKSEGLAIQTLPFWKLSKCQCIGKQSHLFQFFEHRTKNFCVPWGAAWLRDCLILAPLPYPFFSQLMALPIGGNQSFSPALSDEKEKSWVLSKNTRLFTFTLKIGMRNPRFQMKLWQRQQTELECHGFVNPDWPERATPLFSLNTCSSCFKHLNRRYLDKMCLSFCLSVLQKVTQC